MDSEFDITVEDGESFSRQPTQLPINFVLIGDVQPEDAKVYIKQDVYHRLEVYSESDTENERGTILIGEYLDELGKMNIVITDYIEARYTDASASTLTFTHETWEYIHKIKDKSYSSKLIVGWQHTHPGYGVFLSNYDTFIQENFFNMPFQVAYVIDPIQHLRGFFQWKNGKIERLNGYYVFDDLGKKIEVEKAPKTTASITNSFDRIRNITLIAVMLTLIGGMSYATWSALQSYKEVAEIREQLETLNDNLVLQQDEILALKEAAKDNASLSSEAQEIEKPPAKDGEESKSTEFFSYEIQSGDSLEKICISHGIDYKSWQRTLCGLNGFTDPDLIYEGQIILLPIIKTN